MLNEITIKNVSDADLDKWKEIQPSLEHRRRATWSFPIGNSLVTLDVSGPVECKESDVLQYAIDVLEVAKKNALC